MLDSFVIDTPANGLELVPIQTSFILGHIGCL